MRDSVIIGIVLLIVGGLIGYLIAEVPREIAHEKRLADMYLKPPPGQMQGLDANDLAVRQAWTSTALRQSAMKVQGDVQALTLRVDKLEDANDAD